MDSNQEVSFVTVQYSDIRFMKSPIPDEDVLEVLGIVPEYREWVRVVDELDGCKLVHFLTPRDDYTEKERIIEEVGHVRGVILDKDNRIICKSLSYTPELMLNEETLEKMNEVYNLEEYELSHAWEGTLVRLFYHEDDWYVATHRKINAYNSFIAPKSFGDMFEDVLKTKNISKSFVDLLDKQCVYAFVIIHPMNTIIYQVKDGTYDIMLASIYNKETNEYMSEKSFEHVFEKRVCYRSPVNYDTWNSVLDDFKNNKFNDVFSSGIMMTHRTDKSMVKVVPEQYANLRDVRGSNPSIGHRFLELRNNPDKQATLQAWFSDDVQKQRIQEQQERFDVLVSKLHRWYISRFINKVIKEMPKEEHVTLYRCHDWYKTNVKMDPTSRVTQEVVRKILMEAPFHCLVKMLNRITK